MIEQTDSVKFLHFPEVNFVPKAAIATVFAIFLLNGQTVKLCF